MRDDLFTALLETQRALSLEVTDLVGEAHAAATTAIADQLADAGYVSARTWACNAAGARIRWLLALSKPASISVSRIRLLR